MCWGSFFNSTNSIANLLESFRGWWCLIIFGVSLDIIFHKYCTLWLQYLRVSLITFHSQQLLIIQNCKWTRFFEKFFLNETIQKYKISKMMKCALLMLWHLFLVDNEILALAVLWVYFPSDARTAENRTISGYYMLSLLCLGKPFGNNNGEVRQPYT